MVGLGGKEDAGKAKERRQKGEDRSKTTRGHPNKGIRAKPDNDFKGLREDELKHMYDEVRGYEGAAAHQKQLGQGSGHDEEATKKQ